MAAQRKIRTEPAGVPNQLFVLPPKQPARTRLQLRPETEFETPVMPVAAPTFHESLKDCAEAEEKRSKEPWYAATLARIQTMQAAQPVRRRPGMLMKAWNWMQSKYTLSTTKRLRVSETVQLGDKRFVSLVSVGGREFLIGGGTTGVSLLAQLDGAVGRPEAGTDGDDA